VIEQVQMLPFNNVESADATTDVNADAFLVLVRDLQSGVSEGIFARRDGELNKPPHLLDFFFFDELSGVEIFDLTRYLAGEGGGIEQLDAGNTALALQQ